jgi:hypothetical protein
MTQSLFFVALMTQSLFFVALMTQSFVFCFCLNNHVIDGGSTWGVRGGFAPL